MNVLILQLCVFFVRMYTVYTIRSHKNNPILKFTIFSGEKVNVVGTLESKINGIFPIVFKSVGIKQKKN